MEIKRPNRIQAKLPNAAKAELYRKVRARNRILELTKSEAWAELIEPKLKEKQLEALQRGRFKPGAGRPEFEAIAVGCAYVSGLADAYDQVFDLLQEYVNEGEKAQKLLEADRAKGGNAA